MSHLANLQSFAGILMHAEDVCLCGCGEVALISFLSVWVQRSEAQIGAVL